MAVLLLFIDGVGLGRDDPATNPFAAIDAVSLAPLRGRSAPRGASLRALDPTLGVPGLPQSATGQTTLFTGVNAAKVLGRHHTGIPGPTLWPILETESLFRKVVARGGRPLFANAYTRAHLEAKRPRWSASTRMVLASATGYRTIEEIGRERAMMHDFVGDHLSRRGIDVPRRTPEQAAALLLDELGEHDLVLYEYFLTDLAGHRGSPDERVEQARRVEALVSALVDDLDRDAHTLVVVSDHGNLEESAHDRHTLNPVPLLAWGLEAPGVAESVVAMTDLTPVLSEHIAP